MNFTKTQSENLKKYIAIYKKYSKSEEYQRDILEREKRKEFYQSFTDSKIKTMGEYEFTQFIGNLWASRIFGNKEYMAKRIIEKNGFDKIKNALIKLLYGKKDIEERYEEFVNTIKYLGPSAVTEILCHVYPQKAGIWNDKERKALEILGFKELPVNKYLISASEYKEFNKVVLNILKELKNNGFKESDLLTVDYFLYGVWESSRRQEEPEEIEKVEEVGKIVEGFDHDEIKEKVYQIGLWLGFDAETEKTISRGARVDVVWQAKIGNLGIVNYIFEVQKKGSIDSLILNLQKSQKNPTVQKLIIVSDKEQIERIKKETEDLNENFKRALAYWDVSQVQKAYQNLSEITEIIEGLDLIRREF